MKKKLFLAMSICVCACGVFFASCGDDGDGGSCTCKIYDRSGNLVDSTTEDLDDYGLDSCAELAYLGSSQNPGYSFTCKSK